jgi:hypothetical protein
MAAQQSPGLPNFQLIGQALDTFKAEVVKVANLPAWDGGAAIITRLDQLMTQMDHRFEQMDQRFEQMDQRFEQVNLRLAAVDGSIQTLSTRVTTVDGSLQTLTARLDATQHNTNAQFANYTAHSDTSSLVPLHHCTTNAVIAGFPATTGEIGHPNRKSIPNPKASYFN